MNEPRVKLNTSKNRWGRRLSPAAGGTTYLSYIVAVPSLGVGV